MMNVSGYRAVSVVFRGVVGWNAGDVNRTIISGAVGAIGISFYFHRDEELDYMFRYAFMDNITFFGYPNGASCTQKILESCARTKPALTQKMSWRSPFVKCSCTSMH